MILIQTKISDVVIIEPAVFSDERGWFMESFNEKRFHNELIKIAIPTPLSFVQDNIPAQARVYYVGYTFKQLPILKVNQCEWLKALFLMQQWKFEKAPLLMASMYR
jgi:hypothetical protein